MTHEFRVLTAREVEAVVGGAVSDQPDRPPLPLQPGHEPVSMRIKAALSGSGDGAGPF